MRSTSPWRMLALLAAAELLGMSLWFAGSAVAPQLQQQFQLSGNAVAALTTAVQLGFVVGTALSALLNLADVVPARLLFAVSALLGALANSTMAFAPGYIELFVGRFATGVFLAGVYPPAMKMAATWFKERRGLAVGTVVGALTIGKAGPYLVHAMPSATPGGVALFASASAVGGALLVFAFYSDGPFAFPPRAFAWSLVGDVVRERRWRLATAGYLGHMAELYSYWTWIPAFVAASVAHDPHALTASSSPRVALLSFGVIAVGGIGCVWGGLVADRIGRAPLVMRALSISGLCCAFVGLAFGHSLWILAPVALLWGFFIIADSAQFSVLVTESVPAHAVGTALTLQTSVGFLLTTITIQVIPPIVRSAGWPWAFVLLSIGPLLGISAMRRLVKTC
jgi:MFS family permease